MRTRVIAVAVASASMLLGLAGTPAVAASGGHTKVIATCNKPSYKPHRFDMACADANAQLQKAKYSSWTKTRAKGHGTYVFNPCKPDCASSGFKYKPATFTLNKVKSTSHGRLFTRIHIHYSGHKVTYSLPTKPI